MDFDVFFSISQTPTDGLMPDEATMFRNFFEEVRAADELGFDCAWVACANLSTQVQKRHAQPVVPHWQGEIGLNNDIFQLAHHVLARTKRIEVGSAVVNLLCNGGPIARADQVAAFASLHGLDSAERRRLRLGFSAGRFDFMNRAYGLVPRNELEAAAWPALKGKIFAQACEIFLRLLSGEAVSSDDIESIVLRRTDFRSDADWTKVLSARGPGAVDAVEFGRRFIFEPLRIVPKDWRRELVDLVIGSHEGWLQERVNRWQPVKVFNLSITQPAIIDDTHRRMAAAYHPSGGPWRREYMPRTVMVFLDADSKLSPESQRAAAAERSRKALGAYWTALEGTLDPKKVQNASDNALVGNPDDVAEQIVARFHPDDRLMLWFDFFDHDAGRVVAGMQAFKERVVPLVRQRLLAAVAG